MYYFSTVVLLPSIHIYSISFLLSTWCSKDRGVFVSHTACNFIKIAYICNEYSLNCFDFADALLVSPQAILTFPAFISFLFLLTCPLIMAFCFCFLKAVFFHILEYVRLLTCPSDCYTKSLKDLLLLSLQNNFPACLFWNIFSYAQFVGVFYLLVLTGIAGVCQKT